MFIGPNLLRFKQWHEFTVTFFFTVLLGNKAHGSRIHAVTFAGRCWAVTKHMPQMAVSMFAPDLGPDRKELAVLTGHYIFRDQRFAETRPAGTRFILILGAEQRFAGDNINIDTLPVIVPVFILKGRLGAFLLGYFILQRRKPLFKFMFTPLLAVFAPDTVEIAVAPGT